jgi:mannose/cellobiose epimerase-like protein (N-acyl-D-glucosamine 2-epimerase family)
MTRAIKFDDVEQWIRLQALPLWSTRGVDSKHGGFVEHLTLDAGDAKVPYKRVRAQARQVYCFSHAALLGLSSNAAEVADSGWRFLMTHGRRADGAWVRRLSPEGAVLDATSDAYDLAFVLFAHAWRYRLAPDRAVLDSALSTLDALDLTLAHQNGLGWLAEEGDTGPRQQNPHMHLMEAAIELAEATGHPRFFELATTIGALFCKHIVEPGTGILREFFADDWSVLNSEAGDFVEPGHQMEWVWILNRAQDVLGQDFRPEMQALNGFAEAHGIAAGTGLTVDRFTLGTRTQSLRSRSWPQTEALKSNLAMFERFSVDTRGRIAVCVDNLLDRYLAPAPRGTWIDQLDGEGLPDVDKIPSTTLYHLLLAFTELLRLRPRLEALD